ncbi:hypothetical protein C1141_20405 [Vibrio agarivorans]|nr:hypothetical protein C1141_20405 [Vibrio agarivorans]
MSYRETLLGALCIGLVALAYALVGEMDTQDQRIINAHTCEMVASGAWPDEVAADINCNAIGEQQ